MAVTSQRGAFCLSDISRYFDVPLPTYTRSWGEGLRRPRTVPSDAYDASIDPAHVFCFPCNPETNDPGEFFVVAKKCRRCARAKLVCSRGEVCQECKDAGEEKDCVTSTGWIELPPAPTAGAKRRVSRNAVQPPSKPPSGVKPLPEPQAALRPLRRLAPAPRRSDSAMAVKTMQTKTQREPPDVAKTNVQDPSASVNDVAD